MTSKLSTPLVWAIRGYQKGLSPLLPASCRFWPTCSQYALESIQKFGALKGSYLGLRRICRCHPWHPGGVDPVPDSWAEAMGRPPSDRLNSKPSESVEVE
ncbi:membrane protein insertion efficiency factor YidD [Synechococcus sp. PCC 7336]|uniref:membrane protein insertion efficiency factor YidD n=1 Tax=Synechococcus sp. PCC 7336 TaxID=195250 RepID=UPI00034C8B63|nr:membrane protein insertion efficiency factor YidD [Synechococcus sp. PCC 7336]